jgi:drug/metabolite transporter (DMT)-like permease
LFLALRRAPAVEANLINYLWPILMVVLAPWLLPGERLRVRDVAAAAIGFAGAILVITRGQPRLDVEHGAGYLLALGSALVWASYSTLTRRVPAFPTAAVGLFCLVSAVAAALCHVALEPAYGPSAGECGLIALLAIGPMGLAFFFWDAALKRGRPPAIAALSYLTPLGSTLVLVASGRGTLNAASAVGALLIVAAAAFGARRG